MKEIGITAAVLLAVLLLTPLAAQKNKPAAKKTEKSGIQTAAADSFRVLDADTGKIRKMSAAEYVRGAVAGEMPALYEPEALKAQAVAAYTFACHRRTAVSGRNYDISTDSATDQSFLSESGARKKWGENADVYLKKISDAVSAVSGRLVTYDNSPALTVYHAISAGRTESAADVWGGNVPYLVPADSAADRLAPRYQTTAVFTAGQLADALDGLCKASGDAGSWFGQPEKTGSGRVKTIPFCGKSLTGEQLRRALSLRSACFSVTFADGSFTFTVCGFGHGVGMSQYGANEMAKQGSSYREILLHYYPGCTIS